MYNIALYNRRSDSDISVSVVEKLRTLRTKFTERTELIKAKEIEKVEISENESDENETCKFRIRRFQ
ncbi:unnamed protein product [Schistosoma curassoni]|uniref:Uncharacterized protein n=1 Tax=Schistosoma curassoni TaxID=6186 RepID=A0A3P7ZBZ7_9TREM|nr:unnamed protein product [Schistosoma curassoni]